VSPASDKRAEMSKTSQFRCIPKWKKNPQTALKLTAHDII